MIFDRKNINMYILFPHLNGILFLHINYGILCNPKFYLVFLFINLLLILITWIYNDIKPQILILYILTLTAIETVIGLALFFFYYKFMIQKESKIIYDNLIGRIFNFILLQNYIFKRFFNNNYK